MAPSSLGAQGVRQTCVLLPPLPPEEEEQRVGAGWRTASGMGGGRKTGVGDPQDYTGGSSLLWSPPTLSLGTEIPQETLGFRSQVYPEQGLGSGSSSPSVA